MTKGASGSAVDRLDDGEPLGLLLPSLVLAWETLRQTLALELSGVGALQRRW